MKTNRKHYSDAEQKLIDSLGEGYLLDLECGVGPANSPVEFYKLVSLNAFEKNKTGNNVEALRRACVVLRNGQMYRNTDAFDTLIRF